MEERRLTRKRTRVYSLDPSKKVLPHGAIFSQKYLNTLLLALLKIHRERSSSNENEDYEIQKIVRFQVDMALVLSSEFRYGWSRALKQKLEKTHMNSKDCSYLHPPKSLHFNCRLNGSSPYCASINHNSHVVPTSHSFSLSRNFNASSHQKYSKRSKRALVSWQGKRKKKEEDKLFECRLKTLRTILPGGENMGAYELLTEVESYVVCLELQVSILRSIVDEH